MNIYKTKQILVSKLCSIMFPEVYKLCQSMPIKHVQS